MSDSSGVPCDSSGPAFPCQERFKDGDMEVAKLVAPGMSLRDYFAGQALAGMQLPSEWAAGVGVYAELAYQFADAMIAQREP